MAYNKEYYQRNKEKSQIKSKEYYRNNKEKAKQYYEDNKEKKIKQCLEYYHNNKEKIKEIKKKRYIPKEKKETFDIKKWKKELLQNPTENIKHRMRCVIGQCFKRINNNKKSNKTLSIIGLESWDLFREHIENQFTEGMTWDNYGVGKNNTTWHIDHITPISLATTEEEVYKLNYYTNLRPMWGSDNQRKSNKI